MRNKRNSAEHMHTHSSWIWARKHRFQILQSATTHFARYREFLPQTQSTDRVWRPETDKTLPENKMGSSRLLSTTGFGV